MTSTLIQTKLQPPRDNRPLVPRPGLIALLNSIPDRELTLVSAPAGYGKTTLIHQWLAQSDLPFGWLSLDAGDNDLSRFLNYIIAAIQTIFPDACSESRQMVNAPDLPDSEAIQATLINDIAACPRSFHLVLDDYHVLHDGPAPRLISALIQRLPDNMHLVIASRRDPLLPLSRLRAGGQLVELRIRSLRFSNDEAFQFFQISGTPALDEAAAIAVNNRIEGWAAGLQLLALTLDHDHSVDSPQTEMMGSDAMVSDYLFAEVLAQQPLPVQDFLLRTSILDRFDVNLCQAVLEGRNGTVPQIEEIRTIIAGLLEANLFIVSLDGQGDWFRYHHLFQQMLQHYLSIDLDDTARQEIHRRASAWLAANGYSEEALSHALSAGDLDLAVSVVEANSRDLLNGYERRTVERWMAALPEETVWQRPLLLVTKAWLLYRQWRIPSLETMLDRLELVLDGKGVQLSAGERDFLLGQLYTLRTVTSFYNNAQYPESIANAKLAQKRLPSTELGSLYTALLYQALAHVGLDDRETAVSLMENVLLDPAPVGRAMIQAMAGINFIYYLCGSYSQFATQSQQFLVLAGDKPFFMAPANWFAGLLSFEQNRLEDSLNHHTAMKDLRHLSNYVGGFYSWMSLIRILQIQGRLAAAQDELDELRKDTLLLGNRSFLLDIEAMQALQWCLAGEEQYAYRWAKSYRPQVAVSRILAFDSPLLVWARVLTMVGSFDDRQEVRLLLEVYLQELAETGFTRRKIQTLAQLAAVMSNLDQSARALAYLRDAVMLAAPSGAIRSIIDAGDFLPPLLRQLKRQGIETTYVTDLLTHFDGRSGLPAEAGSDGIVDPDMLTRREEEILTLMKAACTNQEIADELVIALSTVKRHASNIFLKLDVNSRRQAVRRAEDLNLLDR